MKQFSYLIALVVLLRSGLCEEVRLLDLEPRDAQQYIDQQDTSLKYAPKIETNVPAVRFLGNEPHNVLEDIYLANQYHGQDGLGGYLYGYAVPDIAKTEKKQAGGDLRGAYNYVGGDGKEIKVEYWDDGTGFHQVDNVDQVVVPVEDTPEVKAAKQEHLRLWQEQAERNSKPVENPYNSAGQYAQGPLSVQGQQQRQQQFAQNPYDQHSRPQTQQPYQQFQRNQYQQPQQNQPQQSQQQYQSPQQNQQQYQPQQQSQPQQQQIQPQYQPQQSQQQYRPQQNQQPNPQAQGSSLVAQYQQQKQQYPNPGQSVQYQSDQSAQNQPHQAQQSQQSQQFTQYRTYGQNPSQQQQQPQQQQQQQPQQQQQQQEDDGSYDPKLYEEENNGPPKGFFYKFDYPVGIIVQRDAGSGQLQQARQKRSYH